MMQKETIEIFKPVFNISTYYIFGGILIILFIPLFLGLFSSETPRIIRITVGTAVIVAILFVLFPIIIYPTMCYKFQQKNLILKCIPFNSKIQYGEIKKIEKIANLGYSPVGPCRLPHYLLGSNYFSTYGWITMYATSYKNVLLIETDKKRYGITPKDEEDFLRILNERLKEGGM